MHRRRLGNPQLLHQLDAVCFCLHLGEPEMHPGDLVDLFPDGQDRIERRHGILCNQRDTPAPKTPIFALPEFREIHPSKCNAPAVTRPPMSGRRPMIAMAVSDFPDPDSPTTPRISPLSTSNEMPFNGIKRLMEIERSRTVRAPCQLSLNRARISSASIT